MRKSSVVILCFLSFFVGCLFCAGFMNIHSNINDLPDGFRHVERAKKISASLEAEKTMPKLSKTLLVVVVISAPLNDNRRKVLRETWIQDVIRYNYSYIFCVGTSGLTSTVMQNLLDEQQTYSDLLLLPHVKEAYNLLTRKVLQVFVWLSNNSEQKFILKCDDDSFVNMKELNKSLAVKAGEHLLYWGYFTGRAPVFRKGKYGDPEWNLCNEYIPYARGGGYILSKDLIRHIAINAPLFSQFKNEDISVGLWLAPINITRYHDIHFDTEYRSRGCLNSHSITHPHDEQSMRKMYQSLTDYGKLCTKQNIIRKSYNYNWDVPPSQCCDSRNY